MGTSQANGSFRFCPFGKTQAVSKSVDVTKGVEPFLAIVKMPIRNEHDNSQISRARQ